MATCDNLKLKINTFYIKCPKLDDQMSIFIKTNYTQEAEGKIIVMIYMIK